MAMYGENYARYGTRHCRLCGNSHAAQSIIEETSASRFKTMQFAAELATIDVAADKKLQTSLAQRSAQLYKGMGKADSPELDAKNRRTAALASFKGSLAKSTHFVHAPPDRGVPHITLTSVYQETRDWNPVTNSLVDLVTPLKKLAKHHIEAPERADWRAMLGVLITPHRNYVAAAGTFADKTNGIFAYVAKKKKLAECFKNKKGNTPSIGGRTIPEGLYNGSKVDNVPGTCAAPKLIQQYIDDAIKNRWIIDVAEMHMSEVYFVPNTATRTAMTNPPAGGGGNVNGLYWTPGLTAHSCETCEHLLPMLLCPLGRA